MYANPKETTSLRLDGTMKRKSREMLALQTNLANVSMAFFLCSALYIRMVPLVLFWSRISNTVPYVHF